MKIKKYFLIVAFFSVSIIALLYGISPQWFTQTFLNIPNPTLDFSHILRAVMCLYLGLGLFWLYSAFHTEYTKAAILTVAIFCAGLVTGRVISLFADGQPSPLLLAYVGLEFALVPLAYWVFKLPD